MPLGWRFITPCSRPLGRVTGVRGGRGDNAPHEVGRDRHVVGGAAWLELGLGLGLPLTLTLIVAGPRSETLTLTLTLTLARTL